MNVLTLILHCVSHHSSRSFETVIANVKLKSAALIRVNCLASYQGLHNFSTQTNINETYFRRMGWD